MSGDGDEPSAEEELTTELGKIERRLHSLRKRREEILDELGESR